MRILRAADHKQMPWKNGGGVTTEIAVGPAGAEVGDFHWRVSMATVAADGPFSTFENIDRILTVLEGAGMNLEVAGMAPPCLTTASAPFAFRGDAAASATLLSGMIVDLNVMTRRDLWHATVERMTVGEPCFVRAGPGISIVFCSDGTLELSQTVLTKYDALFVDEADDMAPIAVGGAAHILIIRLSQNPPVN
ncbi:HutD family protein [Phyllobacterium sp. SB3]|uniref:HutD/Ves family protein n=1 Tax=Phyllobacterium sp. SB3 TaxID=3156073 RepID=UPI0032AE9DB9